jgi:MFS family permease
MIVFNRTIPESPRWLLRQRREADARGVIQSLRRPNTSASAIDAEINTILAEINEEAQGGSAVTWSDVFQEFKPVMIGWALATYNALTGINAVIYYSTSIFEIAGVEEPIIGTIGLQVLNFSMTLLAVFLVDRVGRKTLFLVGTWTTLVALVALGVLLLSVENDDTAGPFAVVLTLLFVAGFASGLGAVGWVYMSEIISTRYE